MSDFDREVIRPMCLTEDDLIRHLKCVGLTIEHDAYKVGKFPERTRSIEISAIVSPGDNVTTVEYRIERTADPRANKDVRDWLAEDLREDEGAEQTEIVRCKDCKHRPTLDESGELDFPTYRCPCQCEDYYYSWMPKDDWFCGNAERRTDG